jgi:hypothetical protein
MKMMHITIADVIIASMLSVHSLFALVIAAHGQDDVAACLSNLQARLVADARVATCSKNVPAICYPMICT